MTESQNFRERGAATWSKVRPYAPLVAFAGGFAFDSVTLGRRVTTLDLYIVSAYGLLTLFSLIARELPLPSWATRAATLTMQFCLGGALSALVVLYFRSTGQPLSLIFVVALFVTMVGNEALHLDEPPKRSLALAIWGVAAVMLANFVLPHIAKSVSAVWFYASAAVVVAIFAAMRLAFRFDWRELRIAFAAVGTLVVLWALGFVPPVPLVYKQNLVCADFDKESYSCQRDERTFWQEIGLAPPTVTTNDAVYCLTAVFAPDAVDVVMEHRWYRRTEAGWERTDEMSFPMTGGRENGWRFWSRKRVIAPGTWKVETALKDGAVLGYEKFEVVAGESAKVGASL